MLRKLPLWLRCCCVVLFTIAVSWQIWLPVTEHSGACETLLLEDSYEYRGYIWLDFGKARSFRIVRCDQTLALLSPDAYGKAYEVSAVYKSSRRPSGYYEVYALTGENAVQYITFEESEAIRRAMLPGRMAILAAVDAALCLLLIRKERQKAASASHTSTTKEEKAI